MYTRKAKFCRRACGNIIAIVFIAILFSVIFMINKWQLENENEGNFSSYE